MSNNIQLDLGQLAQPVTVLIEKISDAIGGLAKPWQIRRIANAEADEAIIKANSQIVISELQDRALNRFITEETIKQKNIESIAEKSFPLIADDAKPEDMESDWIINFFDKSRLISDDEMQFLWSKILAGEANSPGSYSKRTINLLNSLDKSDAILFQSLCNFNWSIGPIIFNSKDSIYNNRDIYFDSLRHLASIGLISFENVLGYQRTKIGKRLRLSYFDKKVLLEFDQPENNNLSTGVVLLTQFGSELAKICDSKPIDEYFDLVINNWKKNKHIINISINGKKLDYK